MGLMNKLNKMKNFLFDEEDDTKETKKSSKKNKNFEETKEIKIDDTYKQEEKESIEELSFDDDKEEKENQVTINSRLEKNEKQFNFPEFDDDDFAVVNKKPESLIVDTVSNLSSKNLYQGSKRKEETKKFKPSPIISPVYGLLDSEGNSIKEETILEKKSNYNDTLDEIRKKVYGQIDDKTDTKELSKKTIEEAEKEYEEEKELSRQKKNEEVKEIKEVKVSKMPDDDDEDDDMILPNVNFKEIDVDEKDGIKKIEEDKSNDEDDDEDTKEQDLFNLIDTMYQNKEEED